MRLRELSELSEQTLIVKYLRLKYRRVRFLSNLSGEAFNKAQARRVRLLQSHNGAPDLMIFEPSLNGRFVGLAIELKRTGETIKKKNGDYKNEHLKQQAEYLEYLNARGWLARFCIGRAEAIKVIDNYLEGG